MYPSGTRRSSHLAVIGYPLVAYPRTGPGEPVAHSALSPIDLANATAYKREPFSRDRFQ